MYASLAGGTGASAKWKELTEKSGKFWIFRKDGNFLGIVRRGEKEGEEEVYDNIPILIGRNWVLTPLLRNLVDIAIVSPNVLGYGDLCSCMMKYSNN